MFLFLGFIAVLLSLYVLVYLQKEKKWAFSKRVVLGLGLGIVIGLVFNQLLAGNDAVVFADWVGMIGGVYVKLLQMIAIPLVFICVILAFTTFELKDNVLKTSITIIGTLIVTAGIAGVVGIFTGYFSKIDASSFKITDSIAASTSEMQQTYVEGGEHTLTLPQKIVEVFPSNPFLDLTGQRPSATIGVVIFALFLGLAYLRIKDTKVEQAELFKKMMDSIYEVVMAIVRLFIAFAPYAVLTIMTTTIISNDGGAVMKLIQFFAANYIGLLVMFLIHLLILAFCGLSPVYFVKKAFPVLSFAFITASSPGALPMNVEMQDELGVPRGISSLAASLSISIGKNGCTGVYPGIIMAIIAMAEGINPLSPQFLLSAVAVIAMTSFGVAATGGGGTVATIIALSALGLPVGLVGVFIAVEPLVDMGRTVVNITGGIVASAVCCKVNGIKLHSKAAAEDLQTAPANK